MSNFSLSYRIFPLAAMEFDFTAERKENSILKYQSSTNNCDLYSLKECVAIRVESCADGRILIATNKGLVIIDERVFAQPDDQECPFFSAQLTYGADELPYHKMRFVMNIDNFIDVFMSSFSSKKINIETGCVEASLCQSHQMLGSSIIVPITRDAQSIEVLMDARIYVSTHEE